MCDCGQVDLPVGVVGDWRDYMTHTETACIGDQR